MAFYIVAQVNVQDQGEYDKYRAGFMEICSRHQGEVVVVSDAAKVFEGDWPYNRVVVLRFPSEEMARNWYESSDYQALSQHRFRSSTAVLIGAQGAGGF